MDIGLNCKKAKIFKIKNRKGYACLCLNHLTEGKTPLQAYERMIKALKRSGKALKELKPGDIKKLISRT